MVANLIVQLVPQPFERAGGDQDGRERRLEVVRERVEQRVLEPVERDQSLLLGPELGDVEQQALQADRMAVRVEHGRRLVPEPYPFAVGSPDPVLDLQRLAARERALLLGGKA